MITYIPAVRPDELYHYGVLGMKWGVRRYQNEDGSWKGGAGRARHASQQAASESGETQHQTHHSGGSSRSSGGSKRKGRSTKHRVAKTIAAGMGVSLLVAGAAYAAGKSGATKHVAKHAKTTLSAIRSKAKNAANSSTVQRIKGKAKAAYNSDTAQKMRNGANFARRKVNNLRRNTRGAKLYVAAGYNAANTVSDVYGAGKFIKKNKNNFKTKEGRTKIVNQTIKNKKWRRKKIKNAAKTAAINAAIRWW